MKTEINNQAKCKIDLSLIKRVVSRFARAYKITSQEVSLALVGDSEIKKLNQTYRRVNQATDVLAFRGEGNFFGEIIIDYNQIKRQAGKFGNSAQEELIFILVHGLLHLAGYNDETEVEKNKMIKLGEEFIKNLKL